MAFRKIFTTFFIFVFSFSSVFSVNENTSLASEECNCSKKRWWQGFSKV